MVVSLLGSAEIGSFVYLRYVVGLDWTPAWLAGPAETHASGTWMTETSPWGAWHVPSTTTRHETRCFSVAVRSNAYGARDRERQRETEGQQRVVVLGDSFAEGFGVEQDDRLTDILERRLAIPFLNFGSALDLGPLQYQILYDRLAAGFTHAQVLIMFLPDNDFTDNDAAYWRTARPNDFAHRHRPYYARDAAGGWEAFYPDAVGGGEPPAVSEAAHGPAWIWGQVRRWFQRNVWTAKMIDRIGDMLGIGARVRRSGYYDYTPDELDAVLWSFRQIQARAAGRPVTIAVIPRLTDFLALGARAANPLIPALRRFGAETGIRIIDLYEPMHRMGGDPARFFLPCDGHWTAEGNRAAAAALAADPLFLSGMR